MEAGPPTSTLSARPPVPFEIRPALPGDEEQLLDVARHLDSVNLPDDRESVVEIVDQSYKSFTGAITDPKRRQYVFVLIDREKQRIVGTSMILAQLGRRDAPYIYFDVIDEEKYSATIDKHFHHTVLRIGYSYEGPTEIGGLVMMPEYRRGNHRLGTLISYVRFLYLASHRELFQDEILAELLPPLEPDGTSHLWEALGRHFTGLSYGEADFLSKKNKEFIKGLFPEGTIYASLLSKEAQSVIGKTGAQTRGVEKLLCRIGFRYADRVDPFDGGPHYTAKMDEISLTQATERTVAGEPFTEERGDRKGIVAVESKEHPYFRAMMTAIRKSGRRGYDVAEPTYRDLGLHQDAPITVLPLE